jgi:hypothetical protein
MGFVRPIERYLDRRALCSVGAGRDYRDAMPVSGIRLGVLDERLDVRITVEQ